MIRRVGQKKASTLETILSSTFCLIAIHGILLKNKICHPNDYGVFKPVVEQLYCMKKETHTHVMLKYHEGELICDQGDYRIVNSQILHSDY